MKKVLLFLLILVISVGVMADGLSGSHPVIVSLVRDDGATAIDCNGEGDDDVLTFTGTLYDGTTQEGQIITQANEQCYFDNANQRIYIDIFVCYESWALGYNLVIDVTLDPYDGTANEYGQAEVIIGSFGDKMDYVPVAQEMQLLKKTAIGSWSANVGSAAVGTKTFNVTKTGTGTDVNVAAPATIFESLPEAPGSRAANISSWFSIEYGANITGLVTTYKWDHATNLSSSGSGTNVMGDKDLLVSVDGVNWIYSDNTSSGVSSVSWGFDDNSGSRTLDQMTVTFTTAQDNALYAVSDGTDPRVTIPNAPAGGTASFSGDALTLTCREVSIPNATYQVYSSTNCTTWTTTVGSNFTASSGTATSAAFTPAMGVNALKFYGIKSYNDNISYLSDISKDIYTYQKNALTGVSGTNKTNLIPLPFKALAEGMDSASELAGSLGNNCNAVVKFDAVTQRYTYWIASRSGVNDFALTADGIYFVNLTNTISNKVYNGMLNTSAFELKIGVNLIYVTPFEDDIIGVIDYAAELMTDIGAHCTKVQQWDTTNQEWDTYTGIETNFALTKLSPVFVYVDADVAYEK